MPVRGQVCNMSALRLKRQNSGVEAVVNIDVPIILPLYILVPSGTPNLD